MIGSFEHCIFHSAAAFSGHFGGDGLSGFICLLAIGSSVALDTRRNPPSQPTHLYEDNLRRNIWNTWLWSRFNITRNIWSEYPEILIESYKLSILFRILVGISIIKIDKELDGGHCCIVLSWTVVWVSCIWSSWTNFRTFTKEMHHPIPFNKTL